MLFVKRWWIKLRKLTEGRMYRSEFLKMLEEGADEEVKKDLENLRTKLGQIFALQNSSNKPVYLIELNDKARPDDIAYLSMVFDRLDLLGAFIPKKMFNILGSVVDDE